MYVFLVNVNVKVDPEVKVRSHQVIDLARGLICISVDSRAQCHHNGAFLLSILIGSYAIDAKYRCPKMTPGKSSMTSRSKNAKITNKVTVVYDNNI